MCGLGVFQVYTLELGFMEVLILAFLRDLHLCSQQKCIKVPFSSSPHCSVCFVIAVLTMVSWTLNVVLVLYRYIRAMCVVVGASEKGDSLGERK